eukprot:6692507-Alexandrium_andersonii.AAC.1
MRVALSPLPSPSQPRAGWARCGGLKMPSTSCAPVAWLAPSGFDHGRAAGTRGWGLEITLARDPLALPR